EIDGNGRRAHDNGARFARAERSGLVEHRSDLMLVQKRQNDNVAVLEHRRKVTDATASLDKPFLCFPRDVVADYVETGTQQPPCNAIPHRTETDDRNTLHRLLAVFESLGLTWP